MAGPRYGLLLKTALAFAAIVMHSDRGCLDRHATLLLGLCRQGPARLYTSPGPPSCSRSRLSVFSDRLSLHTGHRNPPSSGPFLLTTETWAMSIGERLLMISNLALEGRPSADGRLSSGVQPGHDAMFLGPKLIRSRIFNSSLQAIPCYTHIRLFSTVNQVEIALKLP